MPSVALASKLVHDVLRKKMGFTDDTIRSSTACHSRHLWSSRECDEISCVAEIESSPRAATL
ncbi:unnamed protein product [Penicillium camemberti]|uniref:Str. FM013 n=1 Tax=Penicillium camemberti (strain FM 013) TaxID=1429867 RepID=A0A0G4PE38_PENC3|nr:unnamed protein product [Penicillium camemberti]